jgi:hypothetical protein
MIGLSTTLKAFSVTGYLGCDVLVVNHHSRGKIFGFHKRP